MKLLRNRRGFTLIELVLIIVILGVLSSVAVVRYKDLKKDAEAANNMAFIGALRSGISIRFAEQLVRNDSAVPDVIGNDATTTLADVVGLVATTPPSTLTPTPGICGTGLYTGDAPAAGAPVPSTWTITCGAPNQPWTIVQAP